MISQPDPRPDHPSDHPEPPPPASGSPSRVHPAGLPDPGQSLTRGGLLRRSLLLLGVGGLVVFALIWWGGGTNVLTQIRQAHPAWVLAAFVSHYVGFGLRGLRWQWILRAGGANITLGYATGLVVSGWFFNSVAPARAGDMLRVAMLRYGDHQDDPIHVGSGLGAVVAERALDLLAILTLSGFFSLLLAEVTLPPWLGLAYGAIALLLVVGVGGVLAAPPVMRHITSRWDRLQDSKLTELIEQTLVALRAVAVRPLRFSGILLLSLGVWLCDAAILWASVRALSGTSTFQEAQFVGLTSALAAAAPLTPGAMGQIEAAYAALLLLVGEISGMTPSIILLSRGISYWLFLPVSGLITVTAGLHRFWPIIARSRAAASDLVNRRRSTITADATSANTTPANTTPANTAPPTTRESDLQ